jgi:hypothetical protein
MMILVNIKFTNEQKDKFKESAKDFQIFYDLKKNRRSINILKSCKSKGLAILNWSFYDESEYTEGTGTRIEVYNPTNNQILMVQFCWL